MKLLKNPLTYIFILALFLRIYKLGEYPHGLHVDEVKVGWNALSILKTGMDDQLKKLPLYYNSFGDYRPTGIFYLTIPSIALFENSIFAIRFPSSLFGAMSIFAIYYLTLSILKDKRAALFSSFLLAISPWHIEVSRATSEVAISAFFAMFALHFFVETINNGKKQHLYLSSAFIIISYLLYHSIRLLAPLFFISILLFNFKKINKNSIFISLLVLVLSIFFSVTNEGLGRFDQVSISNSTDLKYQITRIETENQNNRSPLEYVFDNKPVIYTRFIVRQYLNYFSGEFLLGESAKPHRYTTPGVGLINYIEVILVILGFTQLLKNKKGALPILLLLISPIPAAITIEDSPNLHRAFYMLPFWIMISSLGYIKLIRFRSIIAILLISNLIFFTHMYFNHSLSHKPYIKDFFVDSPTYRNVGAIELVGKIREMKNNYDQVYITNYPDSPYPWYAYFGNLEPSIFNLTYSPKTNQRVYENLIFSEDKCPTDKDPNLYKGKKILFVNNWECGYESQIKAGLPVKVIDKITRPDNSEVYILLENTN